MFEVGHVCVKLAGKDAGKTVVVVEKLDNNFVVIDGQVKRKRCNIDHLEPTGKTMELKDKASHELVVKAFEKNGMSITAKKTKKPTTRPRRKSRDRKKEAPQELKTIEKTKSTKKAKKE